jgi:hypothetical protein
MRTCLAQAFGLGMGAQMHVRRVDPTEEQSPAGLAADAPGFS